MRKHVVFVVDASRSMERRDVVENGQRKRRVDAVLDCCFEFIEASAVVYSEYTSTVSYSVVSGRNILVSSANGVD